MTHPLEIRIRNNRLLTLPTTWANEVIFPAYDGLSLLNISHTIAQMLGVEAELPLDEAVWNGDNPTGEIDRVVVFLTDGLGYMWLKRLMEDDADLARTVDELTDHRGPVPLTSIAPSTTAVALPTLWSGVSPAQHGMIGTRIFLREFSTLGDMLSFKPVQGIHRRDIFADWGSAPAEFIPVPTLGEKLTQLDVPTHLLLQKSLMKSGLSSIMHRGVTHFHPISGFSEVWLRLHDILKETAGKHCYVSVYWPAVDAESHLYGAHNRYLHAEVKYQLTQLCDLLRHEDIQDGRTLFMIIADHGHHDAPQNIDLSETDTIFNALRGGTGAEARFTYLYLRAEQKQQVIDTIEESFAHCLTWIEPEEALNNGLFGPGSPYQETIHRLGDLILVSRLNWRTSEPARAFSSVSRHGGLSEWEMLIPLLWRRF